MLDAPGPFDAANADPYDPESGEPAEPWQVFVLPGSGAEDPGPIAADLVATEEAFAHLRGAPEDGGATILFLMRLLPKEKAGKRVLGEMMLPKASGTIGQIFAWLLSCGCRGLPSFIMVLDAEFWRTALPMQRRALVWHELEHATIKRDRDGELMFDPAGLPVWDIRGHDLEEFDSVVRRFGAWLPDVQSFIGALRDGGAI